MGDDSIVWKDPPPLPGHRSRHAGKWTQILEPLMEHPKRWALISTGTHQQMRNLASQLRRGIREAPPGFWSFTSRVVDEETAETYARYLGPDAS